MRRRLSPRQAAFLCGLAIFAVISVYEEVALIRNRSTGKEPRSYASMGAIAYGTKVGSGGTASAVHDAIISGFRHLVTAGFHSDHNETGVGEGWVTAVKTAASLATVLEPRLRGRDDLYIQTMFVPWGEPNFSPPKSSVFKSGQSNLQPSIPEQVRLSIHTSLQNLQTDYLDAVVYQNFRAKLQPYGEMLEAWRELEKFVAVGTIRHLGISNVHDLEYLQQLMEDAVVKPSIVQNRFHGNRQYDVRLRWFLLDNNIQPQSFWVLTGNSKARQSLAGLAKELSVTPAMLQLAFQLSLGSTPLVGCRSLEHMQDDVRLAAIYEKTGLFRNVSAGDEDRQAVASAHRMPYACVRRPGDCKP